MKKLFSEILKQLSENNDVVLCVICESFGSTPRKAGAMMACFKDGETVGTVGGGAVEYECTKKAKEVHSSKCDYEEEYLLNNNDAAKLGMVCGGSCRIHFHFIKANEKNTTVFSRITELMSFANHAWMVADFTNNESRFGVYSEKSGFEYIADDGVFSDAFSSEFVLTSDKAHFAFPLYSCRVFVFGGGHVSQALSPLLLSCGFDVTVYEESEKFSQKAMFPNGTKIVNADFLSINESVNITSDDYALVLTRGHKSDNDVLTQILEKRPFYLGVIGSKKKVSFMREYLLNYGFEKEQVEKIYSPVGLSIGAQTPSEIAVSITAQLIAKRAGLI